LTSLPYHFNYGVSKIRPCAGWKPNEDNPTVSPQACIDQLAEIFILRDQKSIVVNRPLPDIVIVFAWRHLRDCDYIVTRGTKRAHHREVATFIGEKAHRLSLCAFFSKPQNNRFLVRQSVGGITNGGVYILGFEARVRVQQLVLLSGSLAQFSQDQLNWNPSTLDDRLTHHHLRIDFYAIGNCHIASILRAQPLFLGSIRLQRQRLVRQGLTMTPSETTEAAKPVHSKIAIPMHF
jgi:hypothetical protein